VLQKFVSNSHGKHAVAMDILIIICEKKNRGISSWYGHQVMHIPSQKRHLLLCSLEANENIQRGYYEF